ncbi:LOW QUALITY PROTEIN: hypothetical protein ACHAWT_001955 [Skeletonema menzelii]
MKEKHRDINLMAEYYDNKFVGYGDYKDRPSAFVMLFELKDASVIADYLLPGFIDCTTYSYDMQDSMEVPQRIFWNGKEIQFGFGVSGQKQLLSSSILVVGAGGIGSTVLLYLAAAGVGHITVVDYDCVEMTNFATPIVIHPYPVGRRLSQVDLCLPQPSLNPSVSPFDNGRKLVSKHDVVVDACDNPRTRYLLNDACILGGKPLVSGSANGHLSQECIEGVYKLFWVDATSIH